MCLVAVHQTCYGGNIMDKVPDGEWYCERCVELRANSALKCRDVNCFLCDEV